MLLNWLRRGSVLAAMAVAVMMTAARESSAQTGACCTSAGVCSTVTADACVGPSLFFGVGSVCTPNACQGACCSNASPSACTVTTGSGCTGTFLGLGSTCSPSPCATVTGACCSNLGVCTANVTPAACGGTSTFLGVGSVCSPGACTASVGPCCSTTGACTLTLPTACALPSTFGVVGNTCAPTNPCTIPTGACCDASGVCNIKPASGTGACGSGETYLGNGTTCSPTACTGLVGACCQAAGTCVTRTIAGCGATTGQTFLGVGTVCGPSSCATGACCGAAAGACTVTIASACVTTTGNSPTFLGNGTTCSPDPCAALRGACCPNGTGACFLTVASGCASGAFAVFNGVGSTCTPTDVCAAQRGACCAGNGGCTLTTGLGCNGNFRGAGTVCTATPGPCQAVVGACCNASGFCSITIGTGCSGANSFRGAGTVCFPSPCTALQGACCSAGGFCTITTAGGCILTNTFLGAGTTCAAAPCAALTGACCSSLGACSVTTANGCAGTFGGAGSACSPGACTPTQGACCNLDTGACSLTTALACVGAGTAWSGGTACNPGNPCAQPTGACCIGTFCSAPETASNCTPVGGVFFFGQACSPTPCVRPEVVISQIYPAGGTTGSVYSHDYVELFNRGTSDVTMTNWSIQFGAQSTQTFPQRAVFSGTIGAGRYFLVRLISSDPTVGAPLPVTPDWIATENINLDTTAGRVALVSNSTPLPNGCPQPLPVNIVDFVGYGNPAGTNVPTCSEGGSPAGGLGGNIFAYFRKASGCQDTDNNGVDFTQPLAPLPRNSSVQYLCGTTAAGACCVNEACSVVAGAGSCAGLFYGEGTTCTANPCLAPGGACCSGLTCTFVGQGSCPSPSVYSFGRACSPSPCTGACCTGAACVITAVTACTGPSYFIEGGTCSPSVCNTPAPVLSGDIVYGASVLQNQDAVQQIRGAGVAIPARVGTWTKFNNLQIVRLDNTGGVLHNAEGNLLAMDFGGQTTGGAIANLPTRTGDASAGEFIFSFTGPDQPFGLQRSRLGGMSVSPGNNRVACIGYDAARLIVLSYQPGGTIGTGAGASIDGGAQTDNNSFVFGFNVTQGTTWLDNDQIIMWVQSDVATVLKLYTVPVSGAGATIALGAPVERLAVLDNKPNSSRFTSVAYNPQLVPGYLFLGSSAFSGITLNTLYIVDITGPTWTLVKTLDLGTSLQTQRELAIGPDRNLYLSQFAGTGTVATDPLIDRIILDADGNGVVSAAEIAALTSNSSQNFYFKGTANTSSFNALDIAISLGACCSGNTCSIQPPSFCTGPNGSYVGNNTVCTPNPCGGACCRGSGCVVTSAAACTGPNSSFAGANTVCNVFPNSTTPCCLADFNKSGSITVQDIFDFLAGYFANSPLADINGSGSVTVQDIFDFLAAYFAGGC